MLNINFYEKELQKELARKDHLEFIKYTWDYVAPYLVGYPTKLICNRIDEVIEKFRNGESSFTIISIPYRHGKTEAIGRTLPPHFLAEFPEKEVIYVTHTADKAYEVSKEGRKLIRDNAKFHELYPDIKLAPDIQNIKSWRLTNEKGKSQYFGFKSGVAGSGAHMLLVDDFFKNREDADSPVISDKVWHEFGPGLMSRLPDPYIVFVLATRWNPKDLIGRILDEVENNPNYPKPKYICLPGISDQYESGYLFPEKFSPQWYITQKATLVTEYEFSSVMQQQPIIRGGNLFKIDNIQIIEKKDVPEHVKEVITIDLASTEVSRKSKDPDYTVCLKGGMVYNKGVPSLYITDLLRFRENATRRNKLIKNFILRHGVRVYMEAIAGYKDSYQTMRDTLMGIISVLKMPQLSGDKVVKASPMEPIFESGNVYLVKGLWNQDLISEVGAFSPSMNHKHDDIVDCMAMIYHIFKKKPRIYNTNRIY